MKITNVFTQCTAKKATPASVPRKRKATEYEKQVLSDGRHLLFLYVCDILNLTKNISCLKEAAYEKRSEAL